MKISRRQFVIGASSAVALSSACGSGAGGEGTPDGGLPQRDGSLGVPDANTIPAGPGPEPDAWQAPGSEDVAGFPWAIQVGDAESSTALVSVRTTLPGLTLKVMRGTTSGWVEQQSISGLTPDDKVVQVSLQGLAPDYRYSLAFYSDSGELRSPVARFRTALPPGESRVIRFGATSCLGGNRPWPSMQRLAEENLDFFCLLGDTMYADWDNDGDVVYNEAHYEAKWESVLAVDGLVQMAKSTSLISAWDDHEVENNWPSDAPHAVIARRSFGRALPIVEKNGQSIWRSIRWGDALEVFVLDIRSERDGAQYISVEQMDWFKSALSSSPCRFKVVMNTVPITKLGALIAIGQQDRWEGHPQQREEILNYISDNDVAGVLWITGDFHFGAVSNLSSSGVGSDAWEVMCGPGGSAINPAARLLFPFGHIDTIVKEFNSVLFEADPDAGTIRFQFIGDDGGVIREKMLTL